MSIVERRGFLPAGQVQGVGFRPFVFRLAHEHGLSGTVGNNAEGVVVEVQGPPDKLDAFARDLTAKAPPLARINSCRHYPLPPIGDEREFRILPSAGGEGTSHDVLISPDMSTCEDCLAELRDPANRRFNYAFTNCTNCGPRYTITRSIPYDRAQTSMSCFPLCPACREEYENPRDRRFHAQPNACPICGPRLWTALPGGPSSPEEHARQSSDQALDDIIAALLKGKIAAIKGLGGFHLACDATNAEAVAALRLRKNRPHKALAVMTPSLDEARRLALLNPEEEALLCCAERPIVICEHPLPVLAPDVAPDGPTLGIMLPYTPLHHVLLGRWAAALPPDRPAALVMTSGNAGGEPICLGNREALASLGFIADIFLLHNRDILIRTDDSVVRPLSSGSREDDKSHTAENKAPDSRLRGNDGCKKCRDVALPGVLPAQAGIRSYGLCRQPHKLRSGVCIDTPASPTLPPILYRRARGFAPRPLRLGENGPCVLGAGAELKSTLCLTRGEWAFVSQHIGDLQNVETLRFYREIADHLLSVLKVKPEAVVCDLHPDYLSTRFAEETGLPVLRLQHHFAHLWSVIADRNLKGPVLGLSLDGTGLGEDGTIWGGELLFVDTQSLEQRRLGRLSPFALPGGEAAIREPRRIARAFVEETGEGKEHAWPGETEAGETAVRTLGEMLRRNINCPRTSSCGRLFDAASALLGLCTRISYEGQAAMRLEAALAGTMPEEKDADLLALPLRERGDLLELDTQAFMASFIRECVNGMRPIEASRAFHAALAEGFADMALRAAERNNARHIALSGGVMQNVCFARLLPRLLRRRGLEPVSHAELPPHDGGLSAGQALWGRAVLRTR